MTAALMQWEWWIIGAIIMLVLEVFVPGAVFLWPGLAALCVGLLNLLASPSWEINLLVFSVLSVAFAYFGRNAYLKLRQTSDHPTLNQRGKQMLGRTCVLETDCGPDHGRARFGDSTWSCRSDNPIKQGTSVVVKAVDGTTLVVEPAL